MNAKDATDISAKLLQTQKCYLEKMISILDLFVFCSNTNVMFMVQKCQYYQGHLHHRGQTAALPQKHGERKTSGRDIRDGADAT